MFTFKNIKSYRSWKSSCQQCLRTQTISIRYLQLTLMEKKNSADVVTQVLSMYLSCSGYEEITNACLDRVVCEYANEESDVEQEERDVISMWVSIVFKYSMDLQKHWVRYDQIWSVSWVGSNWDHEMSLNALLDASRLPNLLILVNKKSRALSGPPQVHSGLVIFSRKCTQMFFWEQLLPGEVAQAICKCQLLTRFMCGRKSTLLSRNFCLLCSTISIHNTHYIRMYTKPKLYSNIYVCVNLIHTVFQDWAHFFASRLALWPQWPMRLVGPQVGSSGLPRWFLQNRCTAGETRERNICSPCRSITCTLPCWDILTHRFPSGQSSVSIWGHMMHRKANLYFLRKTFIFESEVQSAQLVGNNSAICKRGSSASEE